MDIALHCGSCLDVLPTMPEDSAGLVLTDPPYGNTENPWDYDISTDLPSLWQEWRRIVRPGGAIVLFASFKLSGRLIDSWPAGFRHELVWIKPCGIDPFNARYRPLNNVEYILVFGKPGHTYNPQLRAGKPYVRRRSGHYNHTVGRQMHGTGTVGRNDGTRLPTRTLEFGLERGLHPTQKPTKLLEWLINTYSNPGDMVLDCYMGSGSTGVAALRSGRRFVGIEKEEKYYLAAAASIPPQREFSALSLRWISSPADSSSQRTCRLVHPHLEAIPAMVTAAPLSMSLVKLQAASRIVKGLSVGKKFTSVREILIHPPLSADIASPAYCIVAHHGRLAVDRYRPLDFQFFDPVKQVIN